MQHTPIPIKYNIYKTSMKIPKKIVKKRTHNFVYRMGISWYQF